MLAVIFIIAEVGVKWGKFQRKMAIKDKWEKASNGHFCQCIKCGFFHAKDLPCFTEAVSDVKQKLS